MPALERVEGGAGGCERNTRSAGPRGKSPATVGSSVGDQGWSQGLGAFNTQMLLPLSFLLPPLLLKSLGCFHQISSCPLRSS